MSIAVHLELHKSSHSKRRAEGNLERGVILDRGAEIYARDVFLQFFVGDHFYAVGGCPLCFFRLNIVFRRGG